ncbi:hypothetical protein VTK26DRAFT_601 [Humicola hyalothermophila]
MALPLDSAWSRPSSAMASPAQRMPPRSRTQSISSDRPSTIAHSLMSPPTGVSPEAAFIAASAASQIVTNDHDSHAETWYDQHGIEPSGEPAAVSPAALQLVNNFLDQLLFNFLSVSRSTALSALRPAVTEVLKPKLAKDAINQADEELREYLGNDDEEATQSQPRDAVSPSNWDLELAWKRTRLRCMVYSSLGDMEEEDEDYYMDQGNLGSGYYDHASETVSPAVAIFLTSILEYLGEQALVIAGQAAYHRVRLKYEKELKEGIRSPTGMAEKVVVEELDMERVALDRTLGRLWRGWKKKIRSPGAGSMDRLARSQSGDSMRVAAGGDLRSPSSTAELAVPATVPDVEVENVDSAPRAQDQKSSDPLEEYLIAAGIPLPLGPNDVAEIEVPGLAPCSDNEAEYGDCPEEESKQARPKSLVLRERVAPTEPQPHARGFASRKRSTSDPTPARFRYFSSPARLPPESSAGEVDGSSPTESPDTNGISSDGTADRAEQMERAAYEIDMTRPTNTVEEDVAKDDGDEDDEVSIEEPRIVRSSRVSILGRSSSPTSTHRSKPAAIDTSLPVRTPSIHSARLIDVTNPRTPVVGSRRNSVAMSVRQSSSHTSRTGTPPVPDDQVATAPESAPGGRVGVTKSGYGASMSTFEPANMESTASPVPPPAPASRHRPKPAAIPEQQPQHLYQLNATGNPPRSDGAGSERAREPSTPPKLMNNKVTVLPATSSPASVASTTSGTFFIESMPVLPEGVEIHSHYPRVDSLKYRSPSAPQPPALPERSAGRQAVANTSAYRQPATIGQTSVERSRNQSLDESSSSRAPEPAPGPTRSQHSSGSPSSVKLKPVRTSEEGMHARIDVVRDFEELIQSDQTIQYTLTPENMRDIDPQSQSTRPIGAGSPVVVKARKSEDSRPNGVRSRPSSAPRQNDTKASGSSLPRSSGSSSSATMDGNHVNKNFPTSSGKHGGVVPRSIPPMPSKARGSNGPQAREARLPRESLAEFAEFIRSTGPSGDSTAPVSAPLRTGRDSASASKTSLEPRRPSATSSNPNRPKLQARGAAVDYKDDNSDLIDFIRRGPPSTSGNPRIPRAVAPFRTTMDSDQMSGAVGGKAVDAHLRDLDLRNSQASNATEHSVPPSVQSSINSHSALLARNQQPVSYDTVDGDMPMPQRKTRRVRDPYAIDLSDEELEEEDELMQPVKKRAQTQEESLIDFLKNYSPPPEPTVQLFNIAQAQNKPKKKASAPSLITRFTKRDSTQVLASPSSPKPPSLPVESRSVHSRASNGRGGHVPIQVNIPAGVDPYQPHQQSRGGVGGYANANHTSKAAAMMGGGDGGPASSIGGGGGGGGGAGGGRVAMKRFEPREAISVPTRATSDLAEFLRNSGPPPRTTPMVNQFPGPPPERDEVNGRSKMFGRRKKASIS